MGVEKKILLFANTTWYLYNFRLSLAERLRRDGWIVCLVSPPDAYGPRLQELGFRWLPFAFSTRSTNPFNEILVVIRLLILYCREKPDLVHHFTIKCVLYGSLAAFCCGRRPVVNAVTGLGHIFTDTGVKARMLRPFVRFFYRFVLGQKKTRVIFQNEEDQQHFIDSGLVARNRTALIRGSGVNCDLFQPVSFVVEDEQSRKCVLFASRLLREKGLVELLEAARLLREKGIDADFLVAGEIYPENPSSFTAADIIAMQGQGLLNFLGHVDDIRSLLARCDLVVLPSYREGTPRILIEAAAMGKPIVATDIAGCRGLVVDGVNGLLVPVKDVPALARSLEKLLSDSGLLARFGLAGRQIVLESFDEKRVIERTIAVYQAVNG